jgi:hypothetical protein
MMRRQNTAQEAFTEQLMIPVLTNVLSYYCDC